MNLKSLNLVNEGYRKVAVIQKTNGIINDNEIEIWINSTKMFDELGENISYSVEVLVKIIYYALKKQANIKLCGLSFEPLNISYEELMTISEDVEKVSIMMGLIENKISFEQFFEEFKNKDIFFIGEFPKNEKGSTFGVQTLKHNSGEYEAIPVFINCDNAYDYKKDKDLPITKSSFKNVAHFFNIFGIIMEPKQKFWVDISLDQIKSLENLKTTA
ncbi:MAG: hypothetical protein BWY78_01076 [Alphaproteobacteria bacterium ADurb.Bin438]|nr:MAG: hypothetical protein BWY78_01076 [Alphaproteobacteria bacterium ADurb.Bin438]